MDFDWDESWLIDFDHAAFRDRLRDAIQEAGYVPHNGESRWQLFCRDAGVPPEWALTAVRNAETDLYSYADTLQRLAAAVGRDLRWLVTGHGAQKSPAFREGLHQLVTEYFEHELAPEEEQVRLHRYLDQKIDALSAHTPQAAFRKNLPQTWREVAWLHEEMMQIQG